MADILAMSGKRAGISLTGTKNWHLSASGFKARFKNNVSMILLILNNNIEDYGHFHFRQAQDQT
ncbi:MAG: hypothetical protein Q8941_16285 [Bacteroidota bacterium]|nr:hypothetical protein [Bacteroidota bacterium]